MCAPCKPCSLLCALDYVSLPGQCLWRAERSCGEWGSPNQQGCCWCSPRMICLLFLQKYTLESAEQKQEKWIYLSRAELVGEVLGEACRTKAALFSLCRHILCRISFFVYHLFSPFFQLHYRKLKSILKGLAKEQVVIVTVEREQSVTG